jgi:hypothetical protein
VLFTVAQLPVLARLFAFDCPASLAHFLVETFEIIEISRMIFLGHVIYLCDRRLIVSRKT